MGNLIFGEIWRMNVLFVCLGNICRSPLAEGIFLHKIKERGLENHFKADSCGTSNYQIGDPPDPRTIRIAKDNGIELQHSGRQLSPTDLEHYDLIIPMDQSNHASILQLENASLFAGKIYLMRDFDEVGKGEDVPDPYGGKEHDFEEVFEILDRSVEGLISHIIKDFVAESNR